MLSTPRLVRFAAIATPKGASAFGRPFGAQGRETT